METILLYILIAVCFFLSLYKKEGHTTYVPQAAKLPWPKIFDVTISRNGSSVFLKWNADTEPKEIYYEVEKSTDGSSFKTVAIVLGGNTADNNFSYEFNEKQTSDSRPIYRIKQKNNGGSFRLVSEQSL
jgi:hypothetical protein